MDQKKVKALLIVSALIAAAGVICLGIYLFAEAASGWTLALGLLLVVVANVLFMKAGPFQKDKK